MKQVVLKITCLLMLCVSTLSAQQLESEKEWINLFEEGEDYFEQGNYNQAIQRLDDYLFYAKRFTNNQYARQTRLASFYSALASKKLDNDDARLKLQKHVDTYPGGKEESISMYHLGQLEYRSKKYREAIRAFQKVKPSDLGYDELIDFRFQLAYAFFANKDFNKAKRLFKEFKDVEDKYYHQSNYYYAYLTYLDKDYDLALESFKRVDDNQAYKKAVPYYITYIYYQQKKYSELLEYAVPKSEERGLRYSKEINQLIGQTYFTQGKYEEALPYLSTYVSKSPKVRKEDIYQLAFTEYQTEKYGAAIKNFEELTILEDTIGQNALYSLGDCYIKTNQKEKARNAFGQCARLNFDKEIQKLSSFNYGKLSYELGYPKDAIRSLTTFIDKYPNDGRNQEAKRLLSGVFDSTNNYKEALATLSSLGELSDDLKKSFQKMSYLRGLELINAKKYDEGRKYLEQALNNPYDRNINALSNYWIGDLQFRDAAYNSAIKSYEKYLKRNPSGKLASTASKEIANYSIGYSYFKQDQFNKALPYFNKTISALKPKLKDKGTRKEIYSDAKLRSGDCAFMNKDYSKASLAYEDVFKNKYPGADYAAYQKAIIQGLQGNSSGKLESLDKLIERFPQSIYVDDAAFEKGETYLNDGEWEEAVTAYQEITTKYKKSPLVKSSLVKLGLINYNLDRNDQAMSYYKQVVKKYPNTYESKEALAAIKQLYIDMGDPNGYFDYVKKGKYANISDAAQDSVMYLAAEAKFTEGNCGLATGGFTDYLLKFPNGNFAMPAHFYRAECMYQDRQFKKAIEDYDYIVDQPVNIYTEKALSKGSFIAYEQMKDYDKAFKYYNLLFINSSVVENLMEGLRGLVNTTYHTGRYDDFERYSSKLINEEYVTNEDKATIFYYRGKIAYENQNFNGALVEFTNLETLSSDEKTAEGKYLVSEIYYRNKDYAQAKENGFELINNLSSHDYWVVKTFLLLSDIYIENDEIFQAKATLQSIIDNYDGDDLVKQAKKKLEKIKNIESKKSKIGSSDSDGDYLEMDNIDNQ